MSRTDFKLKTMDDVHDYLEIRFNYMKELQEKIIRKEHELQNKAIKNMSFNSKYSYEGEVKDILVANGLVNISEDGRTIASKLTIDELFHLNNFERKNYREYVNKFCKEITLKASSTDCYDLYIKDYRIPKIWPFPDHYNSAERMLIVVHEHLKYYIKFIHICEKCNNTKVLTQTIVEPATYNGFKVNIHQKQEIPCTCTNKS